MSALRSILVAFGVSVDNSEVVAAQTAVEGLIGKFQQLKQVAEVTVAAMAVRRLGSFISETISAAREVDMLATRYSTTNAETQELGAVSEASGVHVHQLMHAFRALNNEANKGASEFNELGINVKDSQGHFKRQIDLFWETGEALSKVEDTTRRTYLAQKLMGRMGQQMMPIFAASKDEIEAFRKKVQETSTVYSDQFIAKAKASVFDLQVLDRIWRKFGGLITEQLLPGFNGLVALFQDVGKWAQEWVNKGEAMNTMITLAVIAVGALTVALAPLVAAGAAAAAPWVALYYVLEDFVTFMRGGKSVIGDFMNKLYGTGGADASRAAIKGLWDDIKAFFAWFSDVTKQQGFGEALIATFERVTTAIKLKIDDLAIYITKKLRDSLGDLASNTIGIPTVEAAQAKAAADAAPPPPRPLAPGEFGPAAPPPPETPVGPAAAPLPTGTPAAYARDNDAFAGQAPDVIAISAAIDWLKDKAENAAKATDRFANWLTPAPDAAHAPDQDAPARAQAWGPPTASMLTRSPALPQSGNTTTVNAPVTVENNITVQGSATAGTARDIASKTGDATVQAVSGRGRDAIGASVGIAQ